MNIWQSLSGRTSSVSKPKNRIAIFVTLTGLLAIFFLLSCLFGSTDASLGDGISALVKGDINSPEYRIIFYIRLPRAIASVLAGAALAVAGVLIQAVLNNPMAAPNIIGVNSGAGLAAALTIAVFPSALDLLPITAFLGALAACLLIYAISVKSGAGRLTVTLVGIAVGSVLNAGINTVKVMFPDSVYDADVFMIGGFSGITYDKLTPACYIIAVCIVLAIFSAKDTDVLCLGETTAASLGVNIRLLRFLLLVIASALAGAAVSFAGLLGFVGLLVPHIMRRFVGNKHTLLIPASAMLGAALVLACDLFSRTVAAPYEIPVGIVLSFVGGIFFICLVLFGKRGVGYDKA